MISSRVWLIPSARGRYSSESWRAALRRPGRLVSAAKAIVKRDRAGGPGPPERAYKQRVDRGRRKVNDARLVGDGRLEHVAPAARNRQAVKIARQCLKTLLQFRTPQRQTVARRGHSRVQAGQALYG